VRFLRGRGRHLHTARSALTALRGTNSLISFTPPLLLSLPSLLYFLFTRHPFIPHTLFPAPPHDHRPELPPSLYIRMSAEHLPEPITQTAYGRSFRRWKPFLRSHSSLRTSLFFGAVALCSLVIYATFLSPHDSLWRRPADWYGLPQSESLASDPKNNPTPSPTSLHTPDPPTPTETSSPWTSSSSDVLTLEQIRDIVAPTRGFFTRDYSLGLGWNNMRYILDAALIQSQTLNRTLILPSFVYARACEFELCVKFLPNYQLSSASRCHIQQSLRVLRATNGIPHTHLGHD